MIIFIYLFFFVIEINTASSAVIPFLDQFQVGDNTGHSTVYGCKKLFLTHLEPTFNQL